MKCRAIDSWEVDIEPDEGVDGNVTVTIEANAVISDTNDGNAETSETFAVDTKGPSWTTQPWMSANSS